MPAPAIVWGVLELVALAITAHELGELTKGLYDGVQKYNKDIGKAKEEIRKVIQSIQEEIAQKVEEKEEVAILLALEAADPQGQKTRKATGRGATEATINAAIEQKIPFRDAISQVCAAADRLPVFSLRRKKGVSLKDLARAKPKIFEELLSMSVEGLTDLELEAFLVIRLKQLAANLLFEFVDECLGWASPLKCEVNFGPAPGFEDHPVQGTTRLQRVGKVNPFYPTPFQYRRGSISADLMISEYRHQRPDKGNIFAIVEIKFPNDRIEKEQFDGYALMLKRAAKVKTGRAPITFQGKPVSSGGRLSLFRYPEDVAVHGKKEPDKQDDSKQEGKSEKSSGRSRSSRKRGV